MSIIALFLGIILLSYVLEDLAIVVAATLSVKQSIPTLVALLAIFIGIATGDIGLYLIGKVAKKVRFLRYPLFRYLRARRIQRKLHQKAFISLFIIRFIPGLRLVGFTLSGFLDVPKFKFFVAVLAATALWTTLVFGSLILLGNTQWFQNYHGWLLIPLGLCLMLLLNRFITQIFLREKYDPRR
ncbi:DedA family protein [Shewanella sp. YIC-542]|uniref:DedA family protein n=1 Tax=Shewanella mytili TaxID=3377111 RepID=UPI00398E9DFB